MKMKNILMIVTGSISCYLFEKIYNKLKKENNVKILFTDSAIEIIKNSNKKIQYDIEKTISISEESRIYFSTNRVAHIDLINWADKLIIIPCTANTLNKITNGIGDTFITTTILAFFGTKKPVYIAPAMNKNMYDNFVVKESIDYLRKLNNVRILYPTVKELACGDFGIGALADIDSMINIINGHEWCCPICNVVYLKDYKTFPLIDEEWDFHYLDWFDFLPKHNEPGSFGSIRKYDIHTGVDIYVENGTGIQPVEDGVIVDIRQFTGKKVGSSWWEDTWCVSVKGKSGIVCYGEVDLPRGYKVGDNVYTEDIFSYVKAVLPENKIRKDIRHHNNAMLHLELYRNIEDGICITWNKEEKRSKNLLDPSVYLYY